MHVKSMLTVLTLGLVSTGAISNEDVIHADRHGRKQLARSGIDFRRDTLNVATRHLHGRSGAHEQREKKLNLRLRSKYKRQNNFDPESFVNNAMGGSDNSPNLISSSDQSSDSTGSSIDSTDNSAGGYTDTSNTGSDSTGTGDTGSGYTGGSHTNDGNDTPAGKAAPVQQGNDPTKPTTGDESSQGSVPVPNGQSSQSSVPVAGGNGDCNIKSSTNGCAHEDGPSTGDPGWTCASGGGLSPRSNNNDLTSRDAPSLRFHKRQNTPAYVQTMNNWRCKFCLPPLTYDSTLEQSAETQSNNAASQGAMVETPPNGQGTVMAEGGGPDFETAVLFWLCEVHTTNIDSCTCANVYAKDGFQWTERGHYDLIVGKQAGEFGSIGCAYDDAMGGLWTCALGMV